MPLTMHTAEDFVRGFERFWAAPSVEALGEHLHADVVLVQPLLARPARGLAAAKATFAKIFAAIPDLRGFVDRWSASGDTIFIELRLRGTVGGEVVEWPLVDRFIVRDGLAHERASYFDPTVLLAAAARHPTSWWPLARSGVLGGLLR